MNLPANKEIKLPAKKNMHVYNYLKVHFFYYSIKLFTFRSLYIHMQL